MTMTHRLLDGRRVIAHVRPCEGHAGGRVLYTALEWQYYMTADYEQSPDGTITFQGRATSYTLAPLRLRRNKMRRRGGH